MAKNPNFENILDNLRDFDRYSRKGFAGLISDTSLLDVETIVYDKTVSGAPMLFRSGTVAVITGVTKSGNRKARFATAADAKGADSTVRFVAVAFSHEAASQSSESYIADPLTGGYLAPRPSNGVNTGRIWMLLNGDLSTVPTTGAGKVAVADIPTDGQVNPFVNGAVKAAAADGTDAIPGWTFTGLTDYDPATGYGIAEVEVNRA